MESSSTLQIKDSSNNRQPPPPPHTLHADTARLQFRWHHGVLTRIAGTGLTHTLAFRSLWITGSAPGSSSMVATVVARAQHIIKRHYP